MPCNGKERKTKSHLRHLSRQLTTKGLIFKEGNFKEKITRMNVFVRMRRVLKLVQQITTPGSGFPIIFAAITY